MRLLAGSRCLVNCIAHPGSVVSAHESRPCSSRLHRSSALRTLHLPACPVPEAHSACCVPDDKGKVRVRVVSEGYDATMNVQFPKDIRAVGRRFEVEQMVRMDAGSFCRAGGQSRSREAGIGGVQGHVIALRTSRRTCMPGALALS